MGGAKEVQDAFIVYNQHTEDDRDVLEEVFTDVFSRFAVDINPTGEYKIKDLEFKAEENHDIQPTNSAISVNSDTGNLD